MQAPKTTEQMESIINDWIDSVDGHDSLDRVEMIYHAGSVLSIISFMVESDNGDR